MGVYSMDEAVFALPEGSVSDRTVTELRFAGGEGRGLWLTVHRTPLPAGETLASAVEGNAREAARSLPGHTELFRREVEMGGGPAVEIAAEWRGEQGVVYTRQAHLAHDGVWVVFAGNAPAEARGRCDMLMDRVVATFRPRG